jgi:hypothetical protein
VFTDDVVMDTTGSGGPILVTGDTVVAFLRQTLGDAVSVHHGLMPEISVTSTTTADGIWEMEDLVHWPDGTQLHGYGHYQEKYQKVNGSWRIKYVKLTRLRSDITNATTAAATAGDK